MRTTQLTVTLLFIALVMASEVYAQGLKPPLPTATAGTEYWIVFQKNFRDWVPDDKTQQLRPADPLQLELSISSGTAARGYVEVRGINFRETFEIPAKGGIITIAIDTAAQVRSSGVVEDLAVHVVSDQPVIVYGMNRRFQTTDTYLAYPVVTLGQRYHAVGYRWLQSDLLSQFAVVATEDNTEITITPSAKISKQQEFVRGELTPIPLRSTNHVRRESTPPVAIAQPRAAAAKKRRGVSAKRSRLTTNSPSVTARQFVIINRTKMELKSVALDFDTVQAPKPQLTPEARGTFIELPPLSRANTSAISSTYAADRERSMSLPMKPTEGVEKVTDRNAFSPFTIRLNKGEVYQVIAGFDPRTMSDLTGSLVVANKPIAFFSGHNCAYVPDPKVKACNLLVEQIPPIDAWGSEFVVGQFAGRSSSVVRVIASEDSTHVLANGQFVATINAGGFYENTDMTAHTRYTTDRPVLVAEFAKGFDNGDNVGDPMMIIIPPVESFAQSYQISTPVRGSWRHYVNVIVPVDALPTLQVDEHPVAGTSFTTIEGTSLAVVQIQLDYGRHSVTCSQPIGLYQYGFGFDEAAYDAYGNAGGWQLSHHPRTIRVPSFGPEITKKQPKEIDAAPTAVEPTAVDPTTVDPSSDPSKEKPRDQDENRQKSPEKIER